MSFNNLIWKGMTSEDIGSLMLSNLQSISDALSELLKVDPNASNDARVLELLKKLSEIEMTPKDLKESRLAKIINGLRKQTTNVEIVAESRSLIKRWRDMVLQKDASFDINKESLVESQNSLESAIVAPDQSNDRSNFAFNCIKQYLNIHDLSDYGIPAVEEPLTDIDLEEFLERDAKRFTDNLPEDLDERWNQLQKPTRRNDGSLAMPFISLDEIDLRRHRFRF
ncbi:Transcription elongation factor A protein 1 [Thelohanellus kitauei]|uniref:Mediator of RNA polymerase II transcription subunit 26 n=1 Tax=Thelohanellus kitauei TaxID=669202 RepID=A0A0C2MT95_THEKT|nr:Transcription elongation factor A protein 1 [Thelohanellus kitauei]